MGPGLWNCLSQSANLLLERFALLTQRVECIAFCTSINIYIYFQNISINHVCSFFFAFQDEHTKTVSQLNLHQPETHYCIVWVALGCNRNEFIISCEIKMLLEGMITISDDDFDGWFPRDSVSAWWTSETWQLGWVGHNKAKQIGGYGNI